jgi:hypothetical protein
MAPKRPAPVLVFTKKPVTDPAASSRLLAKMRRLESLSARAADAVERLVDGFLEDLGAAR